MRIQDQEIIQKTGAHHAPERAIRMAGNLCLWVGEAFIGLSCLYLSWVSRSEKKRNIEKRQTGPLLPVHCGRAMDKQQIRHRCYGCKREVNLIIDSIEIAPSVIIKNNKCEDCTEIAIARIHENRAAAEWN